MNWIFFIITLLLIFAIYQVYSFLRFIQREKMIKAEIFHEMDSGVSFKDAVHTHFSNLNIFQKSNLSEATVEAVSSKISGFLDIMDIDNALDIYTGFVYRKICSNVFKRTARGTPDAHVRTSIENLLLRQKGDYYQIWKDGKNYLEQQVDDISSSNYLPPPLSKVIIASGSFGIAFAVAGIVFGLNHSILSFIYFIPFTIKIVYLPGVKFLKMNSLLIAGILTYILVNITFVFLYNITVYYLF